MMYSHFEILWDDKSGEGLGRHPTANYAAGLDDLVKQSIFSQQLLMSKILVLWIENSFATDVKRKLRAFRSAYTFNTQYDGATMFFAIVKMVRPDTRTV